MAERKSTAKRAFATKKVVATPTTTAITAAKAQTASKAPIPLDVETPKKPDRTTTADTERQKPGPPGRKTSAARKSAVKPSAEQRFCMVQSAAYFLAEKDGFLESATHYWIFAEREIAAQLGESEGQV
jgi:hypothetical protein